MLDPSTGRFRGNHGSDLVVRGNLGESLQSAVDAATDVNGDGYIIVSVAGGGPTLGGSIVQSVVITRAYEQPFALIGCSVTLRDPTPGDAKATAWITPTASSIFVMDLHAADSNVAGWFVDGSGNELRNVQTTNNATGVWIRGGGNALHNVSATANLGVGILVHGNGNTIRDADAMSNAGDGIQVIGNGNRIEKNAAGDRGKGNNGDGISVSGSASVLSENTARSNLHDGVQVVGSGHQLSRNISGGVRDQDNGDCEFAVAAGNVNNAGNKANDSTIAGNSGSPFPAGCTGTP